MSKSHYCVKVRESCSTNLDDRPPLFDVMLVILLLLWVKIYIKFLTTKKQSRTQSSLRLKIEFLTSQFDDPNKCWSLSITNKKYSSLTPTTTKIDLNFEGRTRLTKTTNGCPQFLTTLKGWLKFSTTIYGQLKNSLLRPFFKLVKKKKSQQLINF